ncbi:MAG TPA: DUF4424 family protein [Rhizomicrobium sp.]|jgi:hypothetical protein
MKAFIFLSFLALAAAPAFADDSSAALGAGGVVLTQAADIRMAKEDLYVSPKKVRIHFAFVNDGAKDIDTIVAFPLPDIDMNEFTESPIGAVTDDPVNFVGFTITANGKPVAPAVEQRAFYKGKDVTDIVKRAGVPLSLSDPKFAPLMEKLPAAQRKILEDAGLADGESGSFEHPHWLVRTKFWWRQAFPAHRTVTLDHAYQPVTGQGFFTVYEIDNKDSDGQYYFTTYCIDPATKAAIAARLGGKNASLEDGGMLTRYNTDYILMSGNNWKGAIGHFHMTLDKLKPDNILSLCWKGDLKKTGATTVDFTADNFAPSRDIRMLILETAPKQ